jgi:hypothetical protein
LWRGACGVGWWSDVFWFVGCVVSNTVVTAGMGDGCGV